MTEKPTLVADTEVYKDYLLLSFMNVETLNVREFEMFEGQDLDVVTIRKILKKYRIVTFNGRHFDLPIITEALHGADCQRLKDIANEIIEGGKKYWELNIDPVDCDHIDLIDVAPGVASLKIYGGRLHSKRMQDLPIEPGASISPDERAGLRAYCVNDLMTTLDLFRYLGPQIELRSRMSLDYSIDLRSKSDAQIAEAVIGKQVGVALGRTVYRPDIPRRATFKYTPPAFVSFQTDALKALLTDIGSVDFVVPGTGKVDIPKELSDAKIRIGNGVYRMGIGGLHSSEKSVAHIAGNDFVLIDRDVASYYPAIILNTKLTPVHIGPVFSTVYGKIVDRRLDAKRRGDKVTADALKITINGSFGKFGSRWSKLYSPNLLIQTTVTGQLCLLMLIERIEGAGISVVSANTDGIVIKCPVDRQSDLLAIVSAWEKQTGFETEETRYSAVYSRDVNNYVAVKPSLEVKCKGAYATGGLQKNPTNEICTEAVIGYLTHFTPVEKTIRACSDIRKFVTIRQVKGGAVKDDTYLGKAVRWYYANGISGAITYKSNGYTVARSEGAKPLMDLPDDFPDDINYEWYIAEANAILKTIGADKALSEFYDLVD